jgi:hypothetical protein
MNHDQIKVLKLSLEKEEETLKELSKDNVDEGSGENHP